MRTIFEEIGGQTDMWQLGYPGWGMMGIGILCMVILWALVIGLIIWAVRRNDNRQTNSSGDSAIGIARQRYAKGEITKEQFEQMKKDLNA